MKTRSLQGGVRMATLAAVALAVAAAQEATADELTLDVGSRVRVLETGSQRRLTGRLVDVTEDRLLIETEKGKAPVAIPQSRVTSLQLSTGRNRGRGALYGSLAGLLIGGVVV